LGSKTFLCFPDLTRGKALRWLEAHGHSRAEGLAGVITFMRRSGEATELPPKAGRMGLKSETAEVQPLWFELGPNLRDHFAEGTVLSIHALTHMTMEEVVSHNVIGRLPSSPSDARPELADQAIVVSAHYDHLGKVDPSKVEPVKEGQTPDLIYNGADDDASGVATVLEIARSLSAEGPQAREVIFFLATAEELGILGTRYYLDHPSTPLDRTVANLNFEMLGRADPKAGGPGQLWLSGAERTNLMDAFVSNDFSIVADPYPKMNFFMRSDNIVFCYRGIVGQTFSSYNLHTDYHKVSDDVAGIDFEHMQSCSQAGLRAVRLVADGTIDPEWLPGGMPKPR
jgi:Zn-dependent M28 family amino/carboxypeptidase